VKCTWKKRALPVSSNSDGKREREMEEKHEITGVSKKVGRAVYLLLFRMHVFLSSKKKKQEEREKIQLSIKF